MPYAHEVAAELRSKNKKHVSRLDKDLIKDVPSIYIFNVGTKPWNVGLGSLGQFYIPAREKGQRFSRPLILPGIVEDGVATDMNSIHTRAENGRKVALDIIGKGAFKDAKQNLENVGVFIAAGSEPTEDELLAADAAVVKEYQRLLAEGDQLALDGDVKSISADHRIAAAELKQERDWSKVPIQMIDCPGCGDPVKPGVVMHGGRYGCGWIFDKERAAEGGLIERVSEPTTEEATKGRAKRA